MNEGSKYYPLYAHLRASKEDELCLTLKEIEQLIQRSLPPSARSNRGWWGNRSRGALQARAWMDAGYHVVKSDLDAGEIVFRKPGLIYNVKRDGDTVLWNGDVVRAFRHHMGYSQADLAEQLGMRQQTISDWETGAYLPKRSTSKYLNLVAEKTGFTYGEETNQQNPEAVDDDDDSSTNIDIDTE